MKVRYLPEALAEYEAAAIWYDDHSPEAGDDFTLAIERAGSPWGRSRSTRS